MRLFVGIALPSEIKERLGHLRAGLPGARWVDPLNMHLTLRFIGETGQAQAEEIDAALAALGCPAFDLGLSGTGTFGSGRRLRAVWAGVEKSQTLLRLQAKIEQALIRTGLAPDGHKFTPHVTLARFKSNPGARLAAYLEAVSAFAAQPFHVDGFTLFESHLNRDGAAYQRLVDYPVGLSGGAGLGEQEVPAKMLGARRALG